MKIWTRVKGWFKKPPPPPHPKHSYHHPDGRVTHIHHKHPGPKKLLGAALLLIAPAAWSTTYSGSVPAISTPTYVLNHPGTNLNIICVSGCSGAATGAGTPIYSTAPLSVYLSSGTNTNPLYVQSASTFAVHDVQNSTVSIQQLTGTFLTAQFLSTQPVHDIQNSTVTVKQQSLDIWIMQFASTQTVNIAELRGSTFGLAMPAFVQFATTQTVVAIAYGTHTIVGLGGNPTIPVNVVNQSTLAILSNAGVATAIGYGGTSTAVPVAQMILRSDGVAQIQGYQVNGTSAPVNMLVAASDGQAKSLGYMVGSASMPVNILIQNSAGSQVPLGYSGASTSMPAAQMILASNGIAYPQGFGVNNSSAPVYIVGDNTRGLSRTRITFSTSNYLCETTGGASAYKTSTMTITKAGTITFAPTYTVTTGKTLRMHHCRFKCVPNIPSTTVTFSSSTVYFMTGGNGNQRQAATEYTLSCLMQTNIDSPENNLPFGDDYELPSGTVFAIAHQCSAATIREEYLCAGYEY